MTNQLPATAYIVAMAFGTDIGTQEMIVRPVIAPNAPAAVAMCVSSAHLDSGVKQQIAGIAVSELSQEFIEAARRGFVGDAPVVSIVPKDAAIAQVDQSLVDMGYSPPPAG